RTRLRAGKLDDKEIEIDVAQSQASMEILAPPGMEELTQQIQGMFANLGGARRKRRTLTIREALRLLTDEEALKLVNEEEIRFKALRAVEQDGIVFLDEIDKITSRGETIGADVSRQGVQRDLLPLVEGTAVTTKYGVIRPDHVPEGVRRLAEIAYAVNERTENIGARRLHTVMEKLLEEVSFDAGRNIKRVTIDAAYVDARLKDLAQSEDLARYVL